MNDAERKDKKLVNEQFLRNNEQFKDLPERIQDLILKSPNASADFKDFFANGGRIEAVPDEKLAVYRSAPERIIRINSDQYEFAKDPKYGAMPAETLFSVLAHEIGHDKDNMAPFPSNGTPEQYVQYRSTMEAKAILNAFPIFNDLKRSEPSFQPKWYAVGYDNTMGMGWAALSSEWRSGLKDDQTVIAEIANRISDFPYTRDDQAGDQFKTWHDAYLHDYKNLLRHPEPTQTTPDQSRAIPNASRLTPAESGHPDHVLYSQIRQGVDQLDPLRNPALALESNRENLSASLLAELKTNKLTGDHRFTRVDHVLYSTQADNVFIVRGRLDDPAHDRAMVKVGEAVRTPAAESFQQTESLNQQLQQKQTMAATSPQQEIDPSIRRGPTMAH